MNERHLAAVKLLPILAFGLKPITDVKTTTTTATARRRISRTTLTRGRIECQLPTAAAIHSNTQLRQQCPARNLRTEPQQLFHLLPFPTGHTPQHRHQHRIGNRHCQLLCT